MYASGLCIQRADHPISMPLAATTRHQRERYQCAAEIFWGEDIQKEVDAVVCHQQQASGSVHDLFYKGIMGHLNLSRAEGDQQVPGNGEDDVGDRHWHDHQSRLVRLSVVGRGWGRLGTEGRATSNQLPHYGDVQAQQGDDYAIGIKYVGYDAETLSCVSGDGWIDRASAGEGEQGWEKDC